MAIVSNNINTIVPANNSLNLLYLTAETPSITLIYPTTFIQSPNYFAANLLISPATGLTNGQIVLPNTAIISPGAVSLITNYGTANFKVIAYDGSEVIGAIVPGASWLLNLTTENEWFLIQIGAATSGADATALAGFGLKPYNNKLNTALEIQSENVSIPLSNNLQSKLILWNGGNYEFEIDPAVITNPGFYCYIKNETPTDDILTLKAINSTINGLSEIDLETDDSVILVKIDDATWITILENYNVADTTLGLENGSVDSPSLYFLSQTNTGLFCNGIGDISVACIGQEIINIQSGNNKGLTLLSGQYKLGDDSLLELAGYYP